MESYLENVIQEFKTLIANVEDFQKKYKSPLFCWSKYYYLVPLLCKRSDKIILYVGTNDASRMKADEMLEKLGQLKSLIWEMLPSVKTSLSTPTIRVGKHNANENNIDFIKLLETNNYALIKHPNIKENPLERYGLHLNHVGT